MSIQDVRLPGSEKATIPRLRIRGCDRCLGRGGPVVRRSDDAGDCCGPEFERRPPGATRTSWHPCRSRRASVGMATPNAAPKSIARLIGTSLSTP